MILDRQGGSSMNQVTIRKMNANDTEVISEAFHNQGWD